MNISVHVANAAVLADIKGPAGGKSCGAEHAVRLRDRFIRITQNWIVETERLRELAVGLRRIYTHAKTFRFEAPEHAVARI